MTGLTKKKTHQLIPADSSAHCERYASFHIYGDTPIPFPVCQGTIASIHSADFFPLRPEGRTTWYFWCHSCSAPNSLCTGSSQQSYKPSFLNSHSMYFHLHKHSESFHAVSLLTHCNFPSTLNHVDLVLAVEFLMGGNFVEYNHELLIWKQDTVRRWGYNEKRSFARRLNTNNAPALFVTDKTEVFL